MKRSLIILFFNFIIFTYSSYITNINKITFKELNNYQKILEIQNIPCYMQTVRIKTFNSAFQKKNKFNLKTLEEVNDLIAFRFIFYNKSDLLKFYYHLYNEKKTVIAHNKIIDNNIVYQGILLRYQNDYSECPIYQIECQMLVIIDFYKLLFNENKEKIIAKNLNYPYNRSEI
jgi:hypothetical protein|tara:strand:+ start:9604 stop:10122 length:519 start_codon:yes stop_codon:yes gene_type:complete